MRQNVSYFYCTTVIILACFTTVFADSADTKKYLSKCSKEELMTFFPNPLWNPLSLKPI